MTSATVSGMPGTPVAARPPVPPGAGGVGAAAVGGVDVGGAEDGDGEGDGVGFGM